MKTENCLPCASRHKDRNNPSRKEPKSSFQSVEKVCFISRSGEPPARVLLILTVLTVKISPFLRFLKALGCFDLCGGRPKASRLWKLGRFLFKEAPLTSFDEYEISTKSKIREITEKLRKEFYNRFCDNLKGAEKLLFCCLNLFLLRKMPYTKDSSRALYFLSQRNRRQNSEIPYLFPTFCLFQDFLLCRQGALHGYCLPL